jgi:NADPH-dependent 2,4-dienoyl-CoA reductase/sulfur reductase-like enzyme
MTVGAAQIRYKTSQWVPQSGTWIAGSGPLLWLYASQVVEAGGHIAGILDTTPVANYVRAGRHVLGALRNLPYLDRGLALQRQVRAAGVTVIRDVAGLEALGDGQLTALRYLSGGKWRETPASLLLLHHGVVPNAHATLSLDAAHRWDAVQRNFAPVVDMWGGTTVEGYTVAGDCAGIVGAEASALQGRLAALESARLLGAIGENQRDAEAAPLRAALNRHLPVRPFLDTLFAPRASLLAPADDVLVCRCESITARQIRDSVALGCLGPNQMKAFTRCGMGPCQGRMCGLVSAEIIAQARGVSVAEVGVFNVRPPLKPLSLRELAALVGTE